jgi:hypothetical protein
MSIVSEAAVAEIHRMLKYVLEEVHIDESNPSDIFKPPRIVKPAWLIMPVAAVGTKYQETRRFLFWKYQGTKVYLYGFHQTIEEALVAAETTLQDEVKRKRLLSWTADRARNGGFRAG